MREGILVINLVAINQSIIIFYHWFGCPKQTLIHRLGCSFSHVTWITVRYLVLDSWRGSVPNCIWTLVHYWDSSRNLTIQRWHAIPLGYLPKISQSINSSYFSELINQRINLVAINQRPALELSAKKYLNIAVTSQWINRPYCNQSIVSLEHSSSIQKSTDRSAILINFLF